MNKTDSSLHLDLILRFTSLGDLVLCSGFVKKLMLEQKLSEHTFRTLFVSDANLSPIVQKFPGQCESLGLAKAEYRISKAFITGFNLGKKLLKEQTTALSANSPSPIFNLSRVRIFDLHHVPKSILFSWGLRLAFALKKIQVEVFRTDKKSFKRLVSVWLKRDLLGQRFVYLDHQKLLSGRNLPNQVPELLSNAPHQNKLARKILLAPDAQHWKKRWPIYHWEELFEKFLDLPKHVSFTLVGSKDCLNEELLENFVARFSGRVNNLLGATELTDLPKVAAEHHVCLSGNSAWMHIAEAVNCPVVSLAGPIVSGFGFSPWKSESVELQIPLTCRPCTRHGGGFCHRQGELFHACMKEIEPRHVFRELEKRLL